jgi:hypothetical protein
MSSKRSKAPADDDFDELFEGIGDDSAVKKSTKSKSTTSKPRNDKPEKDILAELESELGGEEPAARPHTPRIKETKRTSTATPPPATARLSEDKPTAAVRKSADSTRSFHASFTPSATSSDLQDAEKKAPVEPQQTASAAGGGGWWGGIFATATATANAAMKQAEAAYKEIQQNEEAKKWAEQVKGNVGALRGLGKLALLQSIYNYLHYFKSP